MKANKHLHPRYKALLLAGLGSCGMASVHLLLPEAYGWKQYLDLIPHRQAWAILAIRFTFSFLLLWGGCLTILAAIRSKPLTTVRYLILYAMATFWAVYVLYQVKFPPPVPDSVRKTLLVVAALISVLYIGFLFTRGPADVHSENSALADPDNLSR